jgi:SAM-dependent methyltransferase
MLASPMPLAPQGHVPSPTHVELGCGQHKRTGFFGIDNQAGPQVDLVLDIERDRLPFPDSSVEYFYSSHMFEHLEKPGSPIQTLREIIRVAKHDAIVEIWTPYGKSNDALLLGHRNFYTETHWQHICFLYDDFYLGPAPGRFFWERTQYVLWPTVMGQLRRMQVPIDFAIDHWFNIAVEFGVFLRVDKTRQRAQTPQEPTREYCRVRGQPIDISLAPALALVVEGPLRHRLAHSLNDALKTVPVAHSIAKYLSRLLARR